MPPKIKKPEKPKSLASKDLAKSLSPAKSQAVTTKKVKFTCPICDEVIIDAVGDKPGEDSIECDGRCATWLHRRCAGLSKQAFLLICGSENPFYCPQCRMDKQELELHSLRDLVTNLSSKLTRISDELALVKTQVTPVFNGGSSYAAALSNNQGSVAPQHDPSTTTSLSRASTSVSNKRESSEGFYLKERKFNILIFGIKEDNKGTPKHIRDHNDLASASQILSSVVSSLNANSIRDCFRLGSYKSNQDRPVLAKLMRSSDVQAILANRKNLASMPGISIKPDLPPEVRKIESMLLKERRSLIDSGVERKVIRIRGNTLFVNDIKHGSVMNNAFKQTSCVSSSIEPAPMAEIDDSIGTEPVGSQRPASAESQSPLTPRDKNQPHNTLQAESPLQDESPLMASHAFTTPNNTATDVNTDVNTATASLSANTVTDVNTTATASLSASPSSATISPVGTGDELTHLS